MRRLTKIILAALDWLRCLLANRSSWRKRQPKLAPPYYSTDGRSATEPVPSEEKNNDNQ